MGLFRDHFHWRPLLRYWPWSLGLLIGIGSALRASGQPILSVFCFGSASALCVLKSVQVTLDSKDYKTSHRIIFSSLCSLVSIGIGGAIIVGITFPQKTPPSPVVVSQPPSLPAPTAESKAALPMKVSSAPLGNRDESKPLDDMKDKSAPIPAPQSPAAAVVDPAIFVDCRIGVMPRIVPPGGRISVFLTYELAQHLGGGGLAEYSGEPGSEMSWTNSKIPAMAFRCDATNYGERALLNIEMKVHTTFSKPVAVPGQPNSINHGEITLDRDWLFTIAKIDTGPANPGTFYIWNCCVQRFVDLKLGGTATAQVQGMGDERKKIRVEQKVSMFAMGLMPVPPEPEHPK